MLVIGKPRLNIGLLKRLGCAAPGYSLGTLTALYAAGARPEMMRFDQHCKSHYREDPNFCGGGWMASFLATIRSALAWLKAKGILRPKTKTHAVNANDFPPLPPPVNFSAMALVAPVGALFAAEAVRRQNAAVALFRLGDDRELRYPYHAFISPFPKSLLEELGEEDNPVALACNASRRF